MTTTSRITGMLACLFTLLTLLLVPLAGAGCGGAEINGEEPFLEREADYAPYQVAAGERTFLTELNRYYLKYNSGANYPMCVYRETIGNTIGAPINDPSQVATKMANIINTWLPHLYNRWSWKVLFVSFKVIATEESQCPATTPDGFRPYRMTSYVGNAWGGDAGNILVRFYANTINDFAVSPSTGATTQVILHESGHVFQLGHTQYQVPRSVMDYDDMYNFSGVGGDDIIGLTHAWKTVSGQIAASQCEFGHAWSNGNCLPAGGHLDQVYMKNRSTGQCVASTDPSNPSALFAPATCDKSNRQLLEIRRKTNGYWQIVQIAGGVCMKIAGTAVGAALQQASCSGNSEDQNFTLLRNEDGSFKVMSEQTRLLVTVVNGKLVLDNPKGQSSQSWDLTPRAGRISLRTASGHYLAAEAGGGAHVASNRASIGAWEKFSVIDLNGGELRNQDVINLRADNYSFVVAEGGGGGVVNANREAASTWEQFRLYNLEGRSGFQTGDRVALRAANGQFVVAENGGNGWQPGSVNANRSTIGAWETFVLVIEPLGYFEGVPGGAKDIGVGGGGSSAWVIGTDAEYGGYGIHQWNGSSFSKVPGGAVRIAVGPDGQPWVVNSFGQIFQRTGGGWTLRPGGARDIGIGNDGSVWIIGTIAEAGGYGIYKWNGSSWNKVPGGAVRIAVGPGGGAWVVNSSGQIFQYSGSGWVLRPGAAKDIGVGGDGSVWVIGTTPEYGGYGIHKWNWAGNYFDKVPGGAVGISVGSDGNPWIVNDAGIIFRWK